jgi:N-ethylmaleimide reductase
MTIDTAVAAPKRAANTLLSPVQLGPVTLPNRVVMAPMTRSRADAVGNPIAPSAVAVPGELYTSDGMKAYVAPRALETGEIPGIVDQFRRAAVFARQAGFDGVELHAANGYLIDQFLRDGSNQRTDRYGGSVANRSRFLIEVVDAVSGVYGADRVGVRLSPLFSMMGMHDSAPDTMFHHTASALREFNLAYLHVVEQRSGAFDWRGLRSAFRGNYMANGGYDRASAEAAIHTAHADLVSFGTPYIANPDLTERFRWSAPLSAGDRATYYGGGAQGYTDYPIFEPENVNGEIGAAV